jgi:uncharacterized protein (TIGR02588 family)
VGTPQQQQNGYIVPITVQNNGDETAEGVQIEVQLLRDGEELERGEFELAFVPRQSSAGGWVTFQEDPQSAQIEARVLGFEQP